MDSWEPKVASIEQKIDALTGSVEKVRKIFFWTLMITLALFILPLVGLIFVIPQFLSLSSGLGQ